MKKLIQCSFGLAIALNTGVAYGATISGSQIVPSTTLPNVNPWTIDLISDGITEDTRTTLPYYNGFVSDQDRGTITLDLVGNFDLTSFILWNDVNVQEEGIKDFRLDFFNSSNTLIPVNFSPTFETIIGKKEKTEYLFDELVPGVSRVDLVVLNSHHPGTYNRIEIREVAFTGTPTTATAVPEPSSILGIAVAGFGMLFARQGSKRQSK